MKQNYEKSFNVFLQQFLDKPICRECHSKRSFFDKTGREYHSIQEKVNAYAGQEYEVVKYENYTKAMTLKHKKCKMISKITPVGFFKGSRCSFCSGLIQTEWITKTICDCTKGQYTVVGSSPRHEILHVKNINGEVKEASPSYFLQELMRPGESEYFSIRTYKPEYPLSQRAKLYFEIVEWCQNHKVWFMEQHKKADELSSAHNTIYYLKKKGLIKSVYAGAYTIHDDYTFLDVLKEKYMINTNSERIGIFADDTAVYLYGIIDNKPARFSIFSNVYTEAGIYACLGEEAFVRGINCKINNNNWKILTGLQLAKYAIKHPELQDSVKETWKKLGITVSQMKSYAIVFGPFFQRAFLRTYGGIQLAS